MNDLGMTSDKSCEKSVRIVDKGVRRQNGDIIR